MPVLDGSPLLAHSLLIGVSGHRKLRHDDIPALQARVRAFLLDLQARYPQLPLVVLSSLAEGSDQLVADVALDLGVRVIAPLPLPLELYRDDFEPDGLARLGRQLQRVEALALPFGGNRTHADVATPGPARDQQYAQAGIFVSTHCHVLLALWDGKPSKQLGGTAQVVGFHLHGHMRGAVDRQPLAATLLGPDQENIVHHLPAMREGDDAAPDAEGRWLVWNGEMTSAGSLPAAFAQVFDRQAAFTGDANKYADAIASAGANAPADAAVCPVWRSFIGADWLASLYQRRVARVLRTTYIVVALMGFAFFTYTDVLDADLVIYLFLFLFLLGMGIVQLAKRREWERKYLDYRTLAEGLRVQSYWRRAGVVLPGNRTTAHENFLQKQDMELGWIRNVMCGASLDGMLVATPGTTEQIDAVVREWIGNPQTDGQLAYYAMSSRRRARLHHRSEQVGQTCIGIAVTIAAFLALFTHRLDDGIKQVLMLALGLLSVAAAVHEAYVHKKADKELIRQYSFMQRMFGSAKRLLDDTTDPGEQRRILVALGEAALTEHAEWSLVHRERPLPRSRI